MPEEYGKRYRDLVEGIKGVDVGIELADTTTPSIVLNRFGFQKLQYLLATMEQTVSPLVDCIRGAEITVSSEIKTAPLAEKQFGQKVIEAFLAIQPPDALIEFCQKSAPVLARRLKIKIDPEFSHRLPVARIVGNIALNNFSRKVKNIDYDGQSWTFCANGLVVYGKDPLKHPSPHEILMLL